MKYRPYTPFSPKVSEIGFGSWQLGNGESWSDMTDDQAVALVKKALDYGINFFDTAPNYANGKSEILLGKAFKGTDRSKIVINTKFGHNEQGQTDFSPEAIRTSIEGSLKRLGTDYLDSVILHNPSRDLMHPENVSHYDILEALKKEGKIRAYGASLDTYEDMVYFMNHTQGQVIEVFFNMNHQGARKAFDIASDKGVTLIAKIPLDSGWLSGKYDASSTFNGIRSRWSKDDIIKRSRAVDLFRDLPVNGQTLSQLALAYCTSYEAVATTIPGCVNLQQLESNVQSTQFEMNEALRQKIETLFDTTIEPMKLPW